MKKAHFLVMMLLAVGCVLAGSVNAQTVDDTAIKPYAGNMARVIQDFELSHSDKCQRPEKFSTVDTGGDGVSLLWVSTFDESFGCLFSCAGGRLEKLLDVGNNAQGEHIDLSFRNGIMIVTSSDAAGVIRSAQFFRYKGGVLQPLEFKMNVVDGSEVYIDQKGKKVSLKKVQKELDKGLKKKQVATVLNSVNIQWTPFRKIGNFLDEKEDITLSQKPVLAYANYKSNEFSTGATMLPAEQYSHIVFKKQIGAASYKGTNGENSVYSLDNQKDIKTMFRGYKDNELYPIIVTDQYLETHSMMPFSRWKYPERVTPMEKEKQRVVSDYFGGRKIKNARWLANLEESDRKLYAVEFEVRGNQALAVIACFIGNRLVSTFDQYALVDKSRGWLWTPGDKGNFMNALPELQGLAVTDEGFELYMSQMVGEERHMIVLREVRSMFVELIDQIF